MKASQKTTKAEFWKRHLAAWAASGETQRAYCERHGLKWHTFHYWRTKAGRPTASKLRLVPVAESEPCTPNATTASPHYLRIHVAGILVEVDPSTPTERLRALVDALRQN